MDQFNRLQGLYSDQLQSLFASDLWTLIRYRLQILEKELEKRSLHAIKVGNTYESARYAGEAAGVSLTIQVIESLPSEINNGKFDADDALTVIENKEGEIQGGIKWVLNKILGPKYQHPKHQK